MLSLKRLFRRRYSAGLHNLEVLYKPIVDEWAVYDSSAHIPLVLTKGVKE